MKCIRTGMFRILVLGCTAVLTVALVPGCSDDSGGATCGDGVRSGSEQCDLGAGNSDTTPNACRADCTLPSCGDGVTDDLYQEQCDDGNNIDFDGCSSTCLDEGTGNCGNGVVDAGEECDDGNRIDGDGCSSTCRSEYCGDGVVQASEGEQCDCGSDPLNLPQGCVTVNSNTISDACRVNCLSPVCGDNVRDSNEECDDGNTASGDGCSANCTFEAGVCGNGVLDAGEQCDDGNQVSGDGCSSTCQFEAGQCGDGVLNLGEECDDGNTVNGDGCSSTCQLEGGVCGNGVIDGGEGCDDGNGASGDGCSSSCAVEQYWQCTGEPSVCDGICGDGEIRGTEECDDSNTASGDGCSSTCRVEPPNCGNGTVDAGEECDDNNNTDCDGCSSICQVEGCGNGRQECAEQCDDGNTTSGDGCSSTCTLEPVTTCVPAQAIGCNQSRTWNTTGGGSTDNLDSYPSCVSWNESGREYAFVFTAVSGSNVNVALTGMTSDLDIFVIEEQGGVCDSSNCIAYGDTDANFVATLGQVYYLVVDGYWGAEGPFSLRVNCGVCGDGIVDPGEECDDGNTTSGDGCSSTCTLEGCGNGNVDAGEECDDGNTTDCDGCSSTCQNEGCGNGTVECAEECDDGNTVSGDGCSSTCTLEGGVCTDAWTMDCGDNESWNTTWFGSTDTVDFYSCSTWDESGREYAYEFVAPQSGQVTVTLSGMTVDLDIFIVQDDNGACNSLNCIEYSGTSATFNAQNGQTYYLVVDGYQGDEGDYTINVSCAGGSCGDGVLNVGEECDDGDNTPCDGCSATCTVEACGNGVQECSEECDDGNNVGGDGCSANCTNEGTDCVPDWYLSCGDQDSHNNGGSGSTNNISNYTDCTAASGETGPEYTYWFYAYESGNVNLVLNITTANQDLDLFVLQAGAAGCVPGATCVDSGQTGGTTENITFPVTAGNYYYFVVDGFGGDVGNYDISVSCSTGNPQCGDGTLDPGEQCDDGNTSSGDGCSSFCSLEGGTCGGILWDIDCGGSDNWSTTGYDNNVSEYGCTTLNESGPEYTYRFVPQQTGNVTVTLDPVNPSDDLDLFVLLRPFGGCTPGNCVDYSAGTGQEVVNFFALAGTTYYIVIDGWNGASGTYDLNVTCQ